MPCEFWLLGKASMEDTSNVNDVATVAVIVATMVPYSTMFPSDVRMAIVSV